MGTESVYYQVQVLIKDVLSTIGDVPTEAADKGAAIALYEELRDAESSGASIDQFDAILSAHGIVDGKGMFYDLDWEGFEIVERNDGSKYLDVGSGYEIVNPDHVPVIQTTLLPPGRWEHF